MGKLSHNWVRAGEPAGFASKTSSSVGWWESTPDHTLVLRELYRFWALGVNPIHTAHLRSSGWLVASGINRNNNSTDQASRFLYIRHHLRYFSLQSCDVDILILLCKLGQWGIRRWMRLEGPPLEGMVLRSDPRAWTLTTRMLTSENKDQATSFAQKPETFTYLSIVFVFPFFSWLHWVLVAACGILAPWPRLEPEPPVLGARSFNHWTTREVHPSSLHLRIWRRPGTDSDRFPLGVKETVWKTMNKAMRWAQQAFLKSQIQRIPLPNAKRLLRCWRKF